MSRPSRLLALLLGLLLAAWSLAPDVGQSQTTPASGMRVRSSGVDLGRATVVDCTTGVTCTLLGSVWTLSASGGGGSTPTGTGFVHITGGVQDGAAKLVDTADITNNAVTLGKLATQANLTILGNISGGAAVPTASTLTAILDAILGTTQGAIMYRNATVWTTLAPGTSGDVLQSGGAAANISWTTLAGGGNVSATGTPTNGQIAQWTNATTIQGITLVPVANGGTNLASGTSGGILAYTAAGVLASSGALTANLPVIGGGAGVVPTVGTRSGNTTAFVTTTGAQTSGDCVKIDANGNHIANGSACGGGGTVDVQVFSVGAAGSCPGATTCWTKPGGVTAVKVFGCGSGGAGAGGQGGAVSTVRSGGAGGGGGYCSEITFRASDLPATVDVTTGAAGTGGAGGTAAAGTDGGGGNPSSFGAFATWQGGGGGGGGTGGGSGGSGAGCTGAGVSVTGALGGVGGACFLAGVAAGATNVQMDGRGAPSANTAAGGIAGNMAALGGGSAAGSSTTGIVTALAGGGSFVSGAGGGAGGGINNANPGTAQGGTDGGSSAWGKTTTGGGGLGGTAAACGSGGNGTAGASGGYGFGGAGGGGGASINSATGCTGGAGGVGGGGGAGGGGGTNVGGAGGNGGTGLVIVISW